MEIIAEVLFTILGGVVEFIFSAVFQIVAELLVHLFGASRASAKALSINVKRSAAFAAYAVGGFLAGLLSIWFAPKLMLEHNWQRMINLLVMPAIVGLLMQMWDNWRYQPDRSVPALPGFMRGYIFAVVMTGVRFAAGK